MLRDRQILLGITGSIAAYKAVDLTRRLTEQGAQVKVVMTEAACRFTTPYMFEAITGDPVHIDLFENPLSHIHLARDAHLFLIAPATANTINKLSCGIADNLLTSLWLAYEGDTLIAPAMNTRMYRNSIVRDHMANLKKRNVTFSGPASGSLACGEEGEGRMVEVSEIVDDAVHMLSVKDLRGRHILVTAGPTVEPFDPVRFISNRSSGKMGYSIARAASRRGADVTLVSGPTSLKSPSRVSFVSVERASEMEEAVMKNVKDETTVIMAAAVCDYSPESASDVKRKKEALSSLNLIRNTDILKTLGHSKKQRILIGFAAESGRNIEGAQRKLTEKNLDMIVLNDISQEGAGFDVDTNVVTLIDRKGHIADHTKMKKDEVADIILDRVRGMVDNQ